MSERLDDHHESPSLLGGRTEDGVVAPAAYELKFLLPTDTAAAVAEWALGPGGLRVDPHGDSARGGRYTTTTLYLDTPALDVYHRRAGYAKRRYRLRRYGDDQHAHLECKIKNGDLVRKRRSAVPLEQVALLDGATHADEWAGGWFHLRIAELGLRPASVVTYQRAAFVGSCDEGPLRVTIDRDARSRLCRGGREWDPVRLAEDEGVEVLGDRAVVELKYLTALPLPFKMLMKNLTMYPGGVSKYRLGREAIGLPAVGEASPARD